MKEIYITKFNKFLKFVEKVQFYLVMVVLSVIISATIICFFVDIEWMTYVAFISLAVNAIWCVILLATIIADKIISKHSSRKRRKEYDNEATYN